MELSNFPTFPLFLLFVRREQLDSLGSVLTSKTPSYIKYSRVFYLLQERNLPFFRELANLLFFLLDKLLALISSLGATLNLPSLPPSSSTPTSRLTPPLPPLHLVIPVPATRSRARSAAAGNPPQPLTSTIPLSATRSSRTHFRARTPPTQARVS
jgi:hypothetical protein